MSCSDGLQCQYSGGSCLERGSEREGKAGWETTVLEVNEKEKPGWETTVLEVNEKEKPAGRPLS